MTRRPNLGRRPKGADHEDYLAHVFARDEHVNWLGSSVSDLSYAQLEQIAGCGLKHGQLHLLVKHELDRRAVGGGC